MERKIVINKRGGFFLVGISNTVNGFKNSLDKTELDIALEQAEIVDLNSDTRWDLRGKYINGTLKSDLEPIAISDEYWFSWKKFHQDTELIRI